MHASDGAHFQILQLKYITLRSFLLIHILKSSTNIARVTLIQSPLFGRISVKVLIESAYTDHFRMFSVKEERFLAQMSQILIILRSLSYEL